MIALVASLGALMGVRGRLQGVAGALAALAALFAICGALWGLAVFMLGRHDIAVATIAVSQERGAAAVQTLNQVEKANAAADQVRRDPVARDAECLRHARNPEDC
jgi:hypothetical protein